MPEPKEHARDHVARVGRRPAGRTASINLEVNGRAVQLQAAPLETLAGALSTELGLRLRATCDGSRCGGCLVLVDGELAPACCIAVVQAEGAQVTTSEGLKSDPLLTPVRRALARLDPKPCDECLPGLIVATRAWLDVEARLPGESVDEALSGNACDCEGRASFVEALTVLSRPARPATRTRPRARVSARTTRRSASRSSR